MTRLLLISTLSLLVGTAPIPASAAAGPAVIYVESGSAGHGLQQERIEACVRLLAKEMGVAPKTLPTVVVIHVSTEEGHRAGLRNVSTKLRVNSDTTNPGEPYYELWFAGDVSTYEYVYSLHYLFERHFGLHETEAEQNRAVARVVTYLDATVSARK